MQQPKRMKWRKQMKMVRHIRGKANRGTELVFGEYGLQALESKWIKARQIEAGRVAVNRQVKRGGKLFIRPFCHKPITKKAAETRMGSGKGSPEYYVAEIREGQILYEIFGVTEELARLAFERCAAKLPIKCKFVKRTDNLL